MNQYVEQAMKTKNIILQKKKQQVGKQEFMMLTRIYYIIIGKVYDKEVNTKMNKII